MEAIPEDFVFIQIHMPPELVADLRRAARAAGVPVEVWLTQLLGRGVGRSLTGRAV